MNPVSLCVTLVVDSPGEVSTFAEASADTRRSAFLSGHSSRLPARRRAKSGGEGWTLTYGLCDTPFGKCLMGESPRGICHLTFVDRTTVRKALISLQQQWPQARLKRDPVAANRLALRIFVRPTKEKARPVLRALVKGTSFQVKVWRALLEVPHGTLTTYGRLAKLVGRPHAARAVGTAVGQNALAFLVPCHRVIRHTGAFGHYRWGSLRKRVMIAWESGWQADGARHLS